MMRHNQEQPTKIDEEISLQELLDQNWLKNKALKF